jgi:predicted dienelactone hydrolase
MLGNFFVGAGLTQSPVRAHANHAQGMSAMAHHYRSFFFGPRDFVHRRRFRRRLATVILIPLLSGAAAYFITLPIGGTGFTLPKSAQESSLSATASPQPSVRASAPGSSEAPAANLVASRVGGSTISGAYKLADGPHAITEVPDIVLHDAKRGKELHVRIFYPNDPGPYPVIVFSHGAGGSQSCCDTLTRHWATYGYVTLQPTHDDSTLQRRNSGEEDINFLEAVREALKKPALWQSRPEDISFVLDSLPILQKRIAALNGKIDTQQIAVSGHSMGAFAADAIAGALVDLPGHPATDFADRRVKAVLLLSPQGPGEFGLNDHSWDKVFIPLLSMTGSLDLGAGKQGPEWRKIPFERSQPGNKYHVFIQGANHMSFITAKTLLPSHATQGDSILGYTNCASLAFWDAYLKADPAAKNYLRSNALPDFTHGAVKLSRR